MQDDFASVLENEIPYSTMVNEDAVINALREQAAITVSDLDEESIMVSYLHHHKELMQIFRTIPGHDTDDIYDAYHFLEDRVVYNGDTLPIDLIDSVLRATAVNMHAYLHVYVKGNLLRARKYGVVWKMKEIIRHWCLMLTHKTTC